MRYGQFCPIAKAAEIVAERWTPLVVAEMLAGSTHFSDIRRGVPLMSQTLLSKRLKELERVGVIERRSTNSRRPEWHLTQAGRALAPVIQHLGEWGLCYAQDPLQESDLDVTILTWNIRRRVDPNVFATRRVTVQFDFTDVPQAKRRWWILNRSRQGGSLSDRSRLSCRPLHHHRHPDDDPRLGRQALVGQAPSAPNGWKSSGRGTSRTFKGMVSVQPDQHKWACESAPDVAHPNQRTAIITMSGQTQIIAIMISSAITNGADPFRHR